MEKVLSPSVLKVLQPQALGPSAVEYDHVYKNEKWHVIEPVSLDFANASDMKERALTTPNAAERRWCNDTAWRFERGGRVP